LEHIHETTVELDHPEPVAVDGALDEEEFGLDDIVKLEHKGAGDDKTAPVSLEVTHHASFNGYVQLNVKEDRTIVVSTALFSTEDTILGELEDDLSAELGHNYKYNNQKGWSNSPCNDDNGNKQSDWELLDVCTKQFGDTGGYDAQTDDLLLWSQQPRVLSEKQAANLFVEAFG